MIYGYVRVSTREQNEARQMRIMNEIEVPADRCFATSKQIYQVKTLSFSALPEFFYVKFYAFLCCIILRFT